MKDKKETREVSTADGFIEAVKKAKPNDIIIWDESEDADLVKLNCAREIMRRMRVK